MTSNLYETTGWGDIESGQDPRGKEFSDDCKWHQYLPHSIVEDTPISSIFEIMGYTTRVHRKPKDLSEIEKEKLESENRSETFTDYEIDLGTAHLQRIANRMTSLANVPYMDAYDPTAAKAAAFSQNIAAQNSSSSTALMYLMELKFTTLFKVSHSSSFV